MTSTTDSPAVDLEALEQAFRAMSMFAYRCSPDDCYGEWNDLNGKFHDVLVQARASQSVEDMIAGRVEPEEGSWNEGALANYRAAYPEAQSVDLENLSQRVDDAIESETAALPTLASDVTIETLRRCKAFIAQARALSREGEGQAIVRELLECWPETSVPNGPLCVRAANYVNGVALPPPREVELRATLEKALIATGNALIQQAIDDQKPEFAIAIAEFRNQALDAVETALTTRRAQTEGE